MNVILWNYVRIDYRNLPAQYLIFFQISKII